MCDEEDRDVVRWAVMEYEFAHAMESHKMRGEYVYYLTEMWFTWPDFGYDAEHSYILN
jgi:hypothetical protein